MKLKCPLLKYPRGRLLDVNVLGGARGGICDHYLVDIRVKVNEIFVRRERRIIQERVNLE